MPLTPLSPVAHQSRVDKPSASAAAAMCDSKTTDAAAEAAQAGGVTVSKSPPWPPASWVWPQEGDKIEVSPRGDARVVPLCHSPSRAA